MNHSLESTRTAARCIATPTGINITPKKTDETDTHRLLFISIHLFHIHLVTTMSPATKCAHAAAAPALVPSNSARLPSILSGLTESFPKSSLSRERKRGRIHPCHHHIICYLKSLQYQPIHSSRPSMSVREIQYFHHSDISAK